MNTIDVDTCTYITARNAKVFHLTEAHKSFLIPNETVKTPVVAKPSRISPNHNLSPFHGEWSEWPSLHFPISWSEGHSSSCTQEFDDSVQSQPTTHLAGSTLLNSVVECISTMQTAGA